MQNGMMNPNVMGNQGSPMMQNMSDGQFMGSMPMGDIYGTRMGLVARPVEIMRCRITRCS
jgi:hypothetical protein